MIPVLGPVSGDGLSRMYAAGHYLYPDVDVWRWVRGEADSEQ